MTLSKVSLGAAALLSAAIAYAPKAAGRGSHRARAPSHAGEKSGEAAGTAITFTGFHVAADGTSKLMVRLAAPVPVEANVAGTKAEYFLRGAGVPSRNNKNPLITSDFVSIVTSARLLPEFEGEPSGGKKHRNQKKKHKPHGKLLGVRVVVQMREDAKPEYRVTNDPDGTATLVITFPKPKKTPTPSP